MACNCKNTVTSFLGGDVANPTTFLNCGEADGTYNNPLSTGKTQCIAEDNVLRILDTYKISGTVKNSGQIVFERTVTGATAGSAAGTEEWVNDGTYFIPTDASDGALSATTLNTSGNIDIGNGNGTVSANTFTAPSISIGKESGVISATTMVGSYSGAAITNATDRIFAMTTATFRPGMVVEFDMGTGSGDITVELPALSGWYYGKYTFLFTALPNAGSNFIINGAGSEKFYGVTMCLDGNEIINGADTITFGAGKTTAGTKVEIISTRQDRMMMYITSNSNKADITPS